MTAFLTVWRGMQRILCDGGGDVKECTTGRTHDAHAKVTENTGHVRLGTTNGPPGPLLACDGTFHPPMPEVTVVNLWRNNGHHVRLFVEGVGVGELSSKTQEVPRSSGRGAPQAAVTMKRCAVS